MNNPLTLILGTYKHYKGNLYDVLEVGIHTETEEQLVVYRALYGDHKLWIRPLAMFLDSVIVDGATVPRFSRVDLLTSKEK